MTLDRSRIRSIVEEVVDRDLPQSSTLRSSLGDEPNYAGRELITEQEVMTAHRERRGIFIAPDAVVTPSARDAMIRYKVEEELFSDEAAVVQNIKNSLNGDDCAKGQVAIGADHGGFEMKEALVKFLQEEAGMTCHDLGTYSSDSVDYPDFAAKVANEVASGRCCRGIVVDGVGIGSAMVANKINGVRAAHCSNVVEAKNAREHNDANVLTLGGRVIGDLLAKAITAVFLKTDFEGGRHQGRIDKIIRLER
ncbi:MAG: ribose 5-phosphate isomerase B [Planctomycetota bacterium]|jgi:ribose 5-phosphate isomerase B